MDVASASIFSSSRPKHWIRVHWDPPIEPMLEDARAQPASPSAFTVKKKSCIYEYMDAQYWVKNPCSIFLLFSSLSRQPLSSLFFLHSSHTLWLLALSKLAPPPAGPWYVLYGKIYRSALWVYCTPGHVVGAHPIFVPGQTSFRYFPSCISSQLHIFSLFFPRFSLTWICLSIVTVFYHCTYFNVYIFYCKERGE